MNPWRNALEGASSGRLHTSLLQSGMSTDRDGPDREPGLTLKDLPDSLNLDFQSSAMTDGEPGERLHGYFDPPAGATLVPDTSDDAIDEQDRIVAGLAGWGESARGGLPREEPVPRMASDHVRVKVRQQQDAALDVRFSRHICVPARHPRRRAVEVDLGEFPRVPLELVASPSGRAPIHWATCCGVAGPYAYK
jgi:hypothetical protein